MPDPILPAISLSKFTAGVLGALVSMSFIKGSWKQKLVMAVGGVILSYYGTPFIVDFFNLVSADGLVGFMLGSFGMSLVQKTFETLQAVSGHEVVVAVGDWIKKKLS
jgi:ABC-type uncharacterized transport system permease subunit